MPFLNSHAHLTFDVLPMIRKDDPFQALPSMILKCLSANPVLRPLPVQMLHQLTCWSLLTHVSEENDDAALALIAEGGFDINFQTEILQGQFSALHLAAMMNRKRVARALILSGAELNLQDKQGLTPLHRAVVKGHEGIVRLLIENEACVDIPNEHDLTPIFLALENGHSGCVQKLIEAKCNVNYRSLESGTPIYSAILGGNLECV